MHKAAKHGGVVGNVRSSHRGRVEDASDELEVRLALLYHAIGLSGCNAELAESACPLRFVSEPSRCSGRFLQRLVRQEAVSVKERNERREDADGCRLSSCRE
eukprot:4061184-Pleurochrysis_carterae.AAC.1